MIHCTAFCGMERFVMRREIMRNSSQGSNDTRVIERWWKIKNERFRRMKCSISNFENILRFVLGLITQISLMLMTKSNSTRSEFHVGNNVSTTRHTCMIYGSCIYSWVVSNAHDGLTWNTDTLVALENYIFNNKCAVIRALVATHTSGTHIVGEQQIVTAFVQHVWPQMLHISCWYEFRNLDHK